MSVLRHIRVSCDHYACRSHFSLPADYTDVEIIESARRRKWSVQIFGGILNLPKGTLTGAAVRYECRLHNEPPFVMEDCTVIPVRALAVTP
jgi:hypothetical protein